MMLNLKRDSQLDLSLFIKLLQAQMYNSTGLSGTKGPMMATNTGVLTFSEYKKMKDRILSGPLSEEQEQRQREVMMLFKIKPHTQFPQSSETRPSRKISSESEELAKHNSSSEKKER